MAIFHFSAQVISRSTGGNALAAAAYRAGEKIQEHDYTKKGGVDYAEILTPENAPEWTRNRENLWSAVEASEKRKDAQLFREINFALPLELKPEERQELAKKFCAEFPRQGMIADLTIHGQSSGNPHAHVMLTMRELTPEGFGKKNRDWNRRELVEEWREAWAKAANIALEQAGHEVRIDHRSLAAQGIDREPTIHQGKHATHMKNSLVCQYNQAIMDMARTAAEIPRTEAELEKLTKDLEKEKNAFREAQRDKTPATAQDMESYKAALLDVIKRDEPIKVTRYYEQWIEPYMQQIEASGNDHAAAFDATLQLAKRDVGEDKEVLKVMQREISEMLRGTGTLGQQSDLCRQIMNAVRLNQDRQEGFNMMRNALLQRQRNRGMEL